MPTVTEAAERAFVHGYATVDMYKILVEQVLDPASPEYKGPLNTWSHSRRLADPSDRAIVAMNVDTPYSYCWLDLRAEPIVITLPSFDAGRYMSAMLVDLYTYILGYVSPRTNGTAGGAFLVAGPAWDGTTPAGIAGVFRSPTDARPRPPSDAAVRRRRHAQRRRAPGRVPRRAAVGVAGRLRSHAAGHARADPARRRARRADPRVLRRPRVDARVHAAAPRRRGATAGPARARHRGGPALRSRRRGPSRRHPRRHGRRAWRPWRPSPAPSPRRGRSSAAASSSPATTRRGPSGRCSASWATPPRSTSASAGRPTSSAARSPASARTPSASAHPRACRPWTRSGRSRCTTPSGSCTRTPSTATWSTRAASPPWSGTPTAA